MWNENKVTDQNEKEVYIERKKKKVYIDKLVSDMSVLAILFL